ncbi:MAG: DNA-processing protein DprA [Campylobacterota bacterium]|nr:DNA-processing protein DprA [Campylobacterota bacterium]
MLGLTDFTNTITCNIPKLARLKHPPKQLFFQGNSELLENPLISIVGSRKMSTYTKSMVMQLASALSKSGVVVVSGGAYGVDATAHKFSYPNTVAIMPCSLDITYPKQNLTLLDDIRKNSLMLSEYEPSTKPFKQNFIARNRVVVGLSDALVIAQADESSGSMHSAKFALESNIPIYVFGHKYGESRGTDSLLREKKATLIDDIDEFVKLFSTTVQKPKSADEALEYFKTSPSYEDAVAKYSEKVFEYELGGKIVIENARVFVL